MSWWLHSLIIGCLLSMSTYGIPQNRPSLNENIVEDQPTHIKGSDEEAEKELHTSENPSVEPGKEGEILNEGSASISPKGSASSEVVKQTETVASSPSPDSSKPISEIQIMTTTTAKPTAAVPVKPLKPVKPLAEGSVSSTAAPERRYPCRCGSGICSCCTGLILENFNVPIRSKACANITYEPDDFAFNFKLLYNNRILYDTRMSAKNPRPVCIPINRYFGVKMCAKLSNVYMSGRNIHACLNMEGFWDDESAFNYSFSCFRIGSNGVAVVRPEDGGGLPPPPDEEEQTDEDYDDTA